MIHKTQTICVSPSPSKIPYGGFSPVRLQTEIQPPPSTSCQELSAARVPPAKNLISGPSPGTQFTRPTEGLTVVSRVHSAKAARSPAAQDNSVQRPLAPQRVILSRRLIAYYGLIRASRSLPPTYAFAGGSSNPGAYLGRRTRGSPIYSLFRYLRAVLRTPVDRMAASGCTSPSALAFAISAWARHPQSSRMIGSGVGSVTRLQGSLNATARRFACPSPTRAFTVELSPVGSLQTDVEYNYAGKQPIPATGLSPARNKALWAASGERRGKKGYTCDFLNGTLFLSQRSLRFKIWI